MNRLYPVITMLCLSLSLSGQNTIGLPQIINYSKNDFQAGTQTWDIRQDNRGIMYFGNNEGMITYDGSHWKLYPLPNKTIVRALATDENDRIYVGGQDEIGYYAPGSNGNLVYTSLKSLIPRQQSRFADIWRIEIYRESVFFQASDRILEYRNNSIKVYPTTGEWVFLKKAGGRLFAQDRSSGLLQFGRQEWVPALENPLPANTVVSGIIETDQDSLLVLTQLDGMFLVHHDHVVRRQPVEPTASGPQFIYTATRINATEFVTGSTSDGCVVMDFRGHIIQQISRTEGLQNNNVLCVFLDRDKNLWAGLRNGISFIAYNAAVKYITPSKANDLSGYSTRIFNNELYIATSDGAYHVPLPNVTGDLSFAKGIFSHIRNSMGEVWRLEEVNRQLLMGQHTGSYLIRDNTGIPLAEGPGSWIFKPISSVFPAQDILTGTYTGLKMIGFNGGQFTDKREISGIRESIRFLEIDNNNTIWASHPYRGIYKLQLAADGKHVHSQLYTEGAGLPSALGNYVFKIKNRTVFGTAKGVYEFDAGNERFVPSAFLAPILGNMEIRYMNEDADGNIWFCSGKKIGVVSFGAGKNFTITYFPELSGQILLGFENIYPFNKENIFIGSEKGIIHLNYEKYIANKQAVKVLLGQVKAIGRGDSVIFGGYFRQGTDLVYQQNESDMPHLPGNYNSFHFEYGSPSYALKNNIEYSYQLKGYDTKWSAWSSRSEKDYTNLPAGKYTFSVKAHDNLGHESETVTYHFVIEPAWYRTGWAYMLYVLLFLAALYWLDKWQKRKMQRQQQKFDEEQKRLKYIHQLEIEKSEKEIIALQNEKLASEITFKNKALADASMHLVERGDALVKVKDVLENMYKKNNSNPELKSALLLLHDAEKNNANWEQFASHFDEINNNFLKKLKQRFPTLSNSDLKVCAYLQLQLSSKEIAQLMAISLRGVEIRRYRLRKKLNLPTEESLTDFLTAFS